MFEANCNKTDADGFVAILGSDWLKMIFTPINAIAIAFHGIFA